MSKGARASQKGSDEQEELNYINIDLLHKALSGSEMHDETCLLFRYDSSDVIVLANEEKEVKFIFIRTPEIKNKNKKREESGHIKRVHGGGRGWIVLLLFMAIIGGGIYLLWPREKAFVETPKEVNTPAIIESDTTQVDSLSVIDSLYTPEIMEEALPTTTIVTPTEVINE